MGRGLGLGLLGEAAHELGLRLGGRRARERGELGAHLLAVLGDLAGKDRALARDLVLPELQLGREVLDLALPNRELFLALVETRRAARDLDLLGARLLADLGDVLTGLPPRRLALAPCDPHEQERDEARPEQPDDDRDRPEV